MLLPLLDYSVVELQNWGPSRLTFVAGPVHDIAITFESLDIDGSFWNAGRSLEYRCQGRVSRSSGQGCGRRVHNTCVLLLKEQNNTVLYSVCQCSAFD